MSEHNSEDHQHQQNKQAKLDKRDSDTTMNTLLESRIARVLHEQAEQIHFTPATRAQIMTHIGSRPRWRRSFRSFRSFMPGFAIAMAAVLVLALVTTSFLSQSSSTLTQLSSVHYGVTATVNTPAPLAHGGHLISLDPTGQYLVYQSEQGVGVMYTASVADPNTSNALAMRYARDATWSPDGSSLVAIIQPDATREPFLALIRTGSFMNPLGHTALAASWSPTTQNQIIYITQDNGVTSLFATMPQQNQQGHLLTLLNIDTPVQHLVWSPDGHTLALLAGGTTAHPQAQVLYELNMQTYKLTSLVSPGNFTLSAIAWSPDSHYIAYQSTDAQGKATIQTRDATTTHLIFTISPRSSLDGWSWSPHSNAIVYSDGGKLAAYVLHGATITFTSSEATQISPFWLPDGRILCITLVQGIGSLSLLTAQK